MHRQPVVDRAQQTRECPQESIEDDATMLGKEHGLLSHLEISIALFRGILQRIVCK